MCAYCVKFKNPPSVSDFQDWCVGVICRTILRGNFLHLKTLPFAHRQTPDELSLPHHCWRQTLYSTGRLIRLGIPPPPTHPLPCNHPVVRHWAVTSMLYHSTWLYSERTWQLRAALRFHCSPFQPFSLQPASLFLSEWGGGGLVKCIIYPCLPPWSGSHTKSGPSPWIQHLPCQHCLSKRSCSWSRAFDFSCESPKHNNPTFFFFLISI